LSWCVSPGRFPSKFKHHGKEQLAELNAAKEAILKASTKKKPVLGDLTKSLRDGEKAVREQKGLKSKVKPWLS